jgi:cell division protein FtsW
MTGRLATGESPERPQPALSIQAEAVPERGYDLVLIGAVLALLSIGTLEIYSATATEALLRHGNPLFFLQKQLVFLTLGGFALWIGATFDYRRLQRLTYLLLLGAVGLLCVVLVMPRINGARRWILMGFMTFQPVELAKLALVTYLAYSLARKADKVKTFTVGFVPHLVVCSAMMALLLMQPDLGSSVVLGATTLAMLFVADARVSYIVLAVLAAAPMAYQLVVGTPWRMQRFMAYFNPEAFSHQEAYQFLQARLAMGSGGFAGAGLGDGRASLGYTPEAHNDFILAPIGEELGFLGVATVIAMFAILIWRGLRAALGARDAFGGYLAFGVTLLFAVQALFNISVVMGILPNKGITLPLVSYGGSSLVSTMFLVGLLLNVGRRPERAPAPGRELVNHAFAKRKKHRVRVVVPGRVRSRPPIGA